MRAQPDFLAPRDWWGLRADFWPHPIDATTGCALPKFYITTILNKQIMGQICPLPQRIPCPSVEVATIMKQQGIQLHDLLDEAGQRKAYVQYTLPSGWKMVDDSWRQDLPCFHIVDADGMIRYTVSGSWKGTYDNELHLSMKKDPIKYEPRNAPVEASQTSTAAIAGKFAEALDPLHRPAQLPSHVSRTPDYTPKMG
jgi:hypothetical protein